MSSPLVSFRDVQKTYRSLQGVDYKALGHFSVDIEGRRVLLPARPQRLRMPPAETVPSVMDRS